MLGDNSNSYGILHLREPEGGGCGGWDKKRGVRPSEREELIATTAAGSGRWALDTGHREELQEGTLPHAVPAPSSHPLPAHPPTRHPHRRKRSTTRLMSKSCTRRQSALKKLASPPLRLMSPSLWAWP